MWKSTCFTSNTSHQSEWPSLKSLQITKAGEDVEKMESESHSAMSDSFWTSGTVCGPPGSSVHGILQARILEWVAMPSSRWSSQPRDQTQVSCIVGGFFAIGGTRKAWRNTGVGCHAFLQVILQTQGSNPGLLHCWRILCLRRHQESLEKREAYYNVSRNVSWCSRCEKQYGGSSKR